LYDSFPSIHRQLSLGIAFFIGVVSAGNFAGLLVHRDKASNSARPAAVLSWCGGGAFFVEGEGRDERFLSAALRGELPEKSLTRRHRGTEGEMKRFFSASLREELPEKGIETR
jgi:hypothetical protein